MKKVHLFIGGVASASLLLLALPERGESSAETTGEGLGSASAPSTTLPIVEAASRPVASLEQLEAQRRRRAGLVWGRDPFMPPPTLADAEPEAPEISEPVEPDVAPDEPGRPPVEVAEVDPPRLSGISHRGDTRWAIIDHEIVRVGDELATGYRVARIDPRAVTLALGSESLTLNLGEGR